MGEKKILNEWNKIGKQNNNNNNNNNIINDGNNADGIKLRFPISGGIKTDAMKVTILLQIMLEDSAVLDKFWMLKQDAEQICRILSRVSSFLYELFQTRNSYKTLLNSLLL